MWSKLARRSGALLLGVVAACGARARAPGGALEFRPYRFVSPRGDAVPAELAYLRVPENRRRAGSRNIELAVLRFRSTTPQPGDPVVYLVGGPGSSAIESVRGTRFPAFMALRAAGDVIALEQRGTGMSRPNLECPGTFGFPLDTPVTREAQTRRYREAAIACAAYWRHRGADLAGYTVLESADDLEALRRALGVPHLVLWGVSYGTHLALATMRRHPALASKAILAGVVGPDDAWPLPSTIDRRFEPIAALGLAAAFRAVVAELDARPVVVRLLGQPATGKHGRQADSVSLTIGGQDFLGFVAGALGDPARAAGVPALIAAAERRDLSAAAPFILRSRSSRSLGSAMASAMSCASGISAARRARMAREALQSVFAATRNVAEAACDVWGAPDLGEDFRRPVRSAIPTLLIWGTRDRTTPPENAAAVRAGLSRGQQLILEGAGHGHPLVVGSPEIARRMLAFLQGQPFPSTPVAVDDREP
jgi:pimeloyl-ACP methyl ester carboxylesterase